MKNLEDLEKFINSELTSKINDTFIKHDNIYINIDHDELVDVIFIYFNCRVYIRVEKRSCRLGIK